MSMKQVITEINGKKTRKIKVKVLVAGGGIGGSALFRYLSEEDCSRYC